MEKLQGYANVVINGKEVYEGSSRLYTTIKNESEIVNIYQDCLATIESAISCRKRGLIDKEEYRRTIREANHRMFND